MLEAKNKLEPLAPAKPTPKVEAKQKPNQSRQARAWR